MKRIASVVLILFALILGFSLGAAGAEKKHMVKKGDTLWDIAGFYYNDPFLWPVIYKANQDSISDPHWIYPGEVFVIPSVPEQVRTLPPAEKEIIVKGKTVSAERGKPTGKVPEETYKPYIPSGKIELFSVVEPKGYAFSQKAAFLAGFISDEKTLRSGEIIKTHGIPGESGVQAIIGETVDLNKGTSDGVSVGNRYTIFEWGRRVKGYGRIVHIKGILSIIKAGNEISTARLLETYEPIKESDYFMEYSPPAAIEGKAHPITIELEGKIIAFKEEFGSVKPYAVVFITPGEGEAKPGDIFLIYKLREGKEEGKAPIVPLGKIQIVYVKGRSASGYITSLMGNMNIAVGDEIRLVGRIGK